MFLLLVDEDDLGYWDVEEECDTLPEAQAAATELYESCSWRIVEAKEVASFILPEDDEEDEDEEGDEEYIIDED